MRVIDFLRRVDRGSVAGIPEIKAWRVNIIDRRTVEFYIRQGRLGGPYGPPSARHSVEAQIFVQWGDGRCSTSTLNRAQLERPHESLELLHLQAYPEPYPDRVPGPAQQADVVVCVPELRDAILHDPEPLIQPVERIEQELRSLETTQIRGGLSAQFSKVTFATSSGANTQYDTTRLAYSIDLASKAFIGRELRRIPEEHDLSSRLHRVRTDFEHLCRRYDGHLPVLPVYLAPALVEQFLNYYLHQNLSMQAILNGSSAFTLNDLADQRAIFHPDLNILDIPVRDEHPSAYRIDERGQTPKRRGLIAEGRLIGVDISLRAATQGDTEPTQTSLTSNWEVLDDQAPDGIIPDATLEDCLRQEGDGVYVYSVLGLHTQDATRGAYSLGVPRALVVRRGRIQGFVRGTLVGNFFDDLRQPLHIIRDPLAGQPIVRLEATFRAAE